MKSHFNLYLTKSWKQLTPVQLETKSHSFHSYLKFYMAAKLQNQFYCMYRLMTKYNLICHYQQTIHTEVK